MKPKLFHGLLAAVLAISLSGCGTANSPGPNVQQTNYGTEVPRDTQANDLGPDPIPQSNTSLPFRDSENANLKTDQGRSMGQTTRSVNDVERAQVTAAKKPQNVIVLIGDGMGFGQMEVARLFEHGKEGRLFVQSLPHVALSQTYSFDNTVTDSAAASTALATGNKTKNLMLGVTPDGKPAESLLDSFQLAGKKVGLVSTNTATDATPAGFASKVLTRAGQDEVARQMFSSQVDVILGGGRSNFTPEKQNGVDLIQQFRDSGYTYVTDRTELNAATGDKLLGLFHDSFMNYKIDRDELGSNEPTLKEMTAKTLEFLSKGDQGFFAMIEGARIDHAAHAADFTSIWKETIEFDEAVRYAVDWAKNNGDTLVLALADHETMGIAATEPMDIQKLKAIPVTPEYMAAQLVVDPATNNTYTVDSVRNVFKQYAGLDLTDDQIAEFNSRVVDAQGKLSPSFKIGWEIGSIIADRHHAGAINTEIRSLSSTGGHSANMVPIFAYGVGAESFNGVLDNTDVPKLVAKIAGISMQNLKVYVGTQRVRFAVQPMITNGRTLVPIREISEALGAAVDWDPATRTVSIRKDQLTVTLVIGQNQATKDNETLALDVPAQVVQGRTMLPLRFVSEALGSEVGWDEPTKTITITPPAAAAPAS